MLLEGDMPTYLREQSDDTEITARLMEEAGEPRLAASVKEALEKKNPASVVPRKVDGSKGGKPLAAKLQAKQRSLIARKPAKISRKQKG